MAFAERVDAAWANVLRPEETAVTDHRCAECDAIAAYFGGRSWRELTNIDDLRNHADALFLFSAVAFHYYLPAFMCASLENPRAAGLVPDNIASTFRLEFGVASRDRLTMFDSRQRNLVGEFLEMSLPELFEEDRDDIRTVSALLRGA